MTQQPAGYEDSDIPLQSGRLRMRRWGAADAPAVLCVPGLSANLCGFDRLAEQLAGDTLQLVAIGLRGRGRSEVTGPGTYGWRNHARDVLAVADAVGALSFAVIGQSSSAAIAMTCAQLEPSRIERLVLVDLAGSPDERAAVPVVASVGRLGTVYPSAQAALALIKQIGIIPGWDEYWDRYFLYELRDGVAASSDRGAVLEDLGYGNAMYWPGPEAPVHALWDAVTISALVLRAQREILPGSGSSCPPRRCSGSRRRYRRRAWRRSTPTTTRSRRTTIPSPPSAHSCARADVPWPASATRSRRSAGVESAACPPLSCA
jgi:pimeloyl-ACP methyl ester carboxylesterase